jgi:hypothetical protein
MNAECEADDWIEDTKVRCGRPAVDFVRDRGQLYFVCRLHLLWWRQEHGVPPAE